MVSFYRWWRKLRADATATPSCAKFVPVVLAARRPAESATEMSVEFPGGVRVQLEVTGGATVQA